jgi:hypothetical protein
MGYGSRATWQKISKKGHYPSPRCGAAMVVYKNKGLVVGGVFDDEGPQHSMSSTFYADMFAFDMERKRWYQLGLKRASASSSGSGGVGKKEKRKAAAAAAGADGGDNDNDEDEGEEGGDEEEEGGQGRVGRGVGGDEEGEEGEEALEGRELFGYIDDSGNLCYLDMEEDGEGAVLVIPAATPLAVLEGGAAAGTDADADVDAGKEAGGIAVDDIAVTVPVPASEKTVPTLPSPAPTPAAVATRPAFASAPVSSQPLSSSSQLVSGSGGCVLPGGAALSAYFSERTEPSPRINPCLMIKVGREETRREQGGSA